MDLLAIRARMELDRGQWDAAEATAQQVAADPHRWWIPPMLTVTASALARARRGEPGAAALLDEVWALAEPDRARSSGSVPIAALVLRSHGWRATWRASQR